jgi:hypothetical protein
MLDKLEGNKMRGRGSWPTYLPGRGPWLIKNSHDLGQWPPLHMGGALVYHLDVVICDSGDTCTHGPYYINLKVLNLLYLYKYE